VPNERRQLELQLLRAVARMRWSPTADHRRELDEALDKMIMYCGTLARLLALLDQALTEEKRDE
jgi:hypothetical protein